MFTLKLITKAWLMKKTFSSIIPDYIKIVKRLSLNTWTRRRTNFLYLPAIGIKTCVLDTFLCILFLVVKPSVRVVLSMEIKTARQELKYYHSNFYQRQWAAFLFSYLSSANSRICAVHESPPFGSSNVIATRHQTPRVCFVYEFFVYSKT